ncbi:CAP domain-containing protein [Psychrobacter pygoscelis]|uniref:CAP domain-containing protein n=1 Tax=Psychrobacter pygoscelis TaxID=2488563 RepID=UPI001039DB61|nr:hypothetical protein [Psychrobacter pygoscelis]
MKFSPTVNHSLITRILPLAVLTASLAACGGGGGDSSPVPTTPSAPSDTAPTPKPNPPQGGQVAKPDEVLVTPVAPSKPTNPSKPAEPSTDQPPPSTPSYDGITMTQSERAVFERLNARRETCGFGGLNANSKLMMAANNHTNYLLHMTQFSAQPFQGHYETGVDEFSGTKNPYYSGRAVADRLSTTSRKGAKAVAVNYPYYTVAENLSFLRFNDTYFDKNGDEQLALKGINGLLAAPYHMASLLSPEFADIGIGYGRTPMKSPFKLEGGGNTDGQASVLEMVLAVQRDNIRTPPNQVISYPCTGTVGTQYELKHESPNPFSNTNRNLAKDPIGQPIFILANGSLRVSNYKMTDAANNEIALQALTAKNDPNHILEPTQVILMPLTALQPNQTYRVTYQASVNGASSEPYEVIFSTKAQ